MILNTYYPSHFTAFLLGIALYLIQIPAAFASSTYPEPFEKLSNLKGQAKLDSAYILFYRHHNDWDTLQGITILQKLVKTAQKAGNKEEEIFFLNQTAYYYAYAQKMGSQHQKAVRMYQQILQKAEDFGLPYWIAYSHHQLGLLYDTISETEDALGHYWDAQALFKQIGYAKSPWMKEFLFDWAKFNFTRFYQIDTILAYLYEANTYTCINPRKNIEANNLMGTIYQNEEFFKINGSDSSIKYFNRSFDLAKQYQDSAWMGISIGNLGAVYEFANKFDLAIPLIRQDSIASRKYNEILSLFNCTVHLADIYRQQGKLALADKMLKQVEKENRALKDTFYIRQMYLFKAYTAYDMGKYEEAYRALRQHQGVEDAFLKSRKIAKTASAKILLYKNIYQKQKELIAKSKENALLYRNSLIGLLLLSLIIAYILYNRRQLKNEAEKKILEQKRLLELSEKKRMTDELENAKEQLATYLENLLQKNELIEKVSAELQQYESQNPKKENTISLNELYNARLLTDEDWMQFKALFDKVHPNFLNNLRKQIKELSPADLRIIALEKLNISGKEMALMLGISHDAVRKAKYRLKKKLELSEYSNLA